MSPPRNSPTNPSGEQAIDLDARRQARRAEQQADRAFQVALDDGNALAALKNGHAHMVELFGAMSADVARLTKRIEMAEMARTLDANDFRASLARLELKLGTRTAISITEEAGAAYVRAGASQIEAAARTAVIDAEAKAYAAKERWEATKRVAARLGPILVAVVAIIVSQLNSCSPLLP